MAKTKKVITKSPADDILNVKGTNLPEVFAVMAKEYYEAFLKQGFTTDQSFELMVLILRGYILR